VPAPGAGEHQPAGSGQPRPRDPHQATAHAGADHSAGDAAINADIYPQTMEIIQRPERLGGWRALPTREIFDVEYWELEQAELR